MNLPRNVKETPNFKEFSTILDEKSLESVRDWAQTTQREQVQRNKLFFRSPHNKFEIWAAGIPNSAANKGKSGGFRLLYFYIFYEDCEDLYLDFIDERQNLGFKNEHPKKKAKFEKYLKDLKKELLSSLES
jgi:hypothetical protein